MEQADIDKRKQSFLDWAPTLDRPFYNMLFELTDSQHFSIRYSKKSFGFYVTVGNRKIRLVELEAQNHDEAGRAYFYVHFVREVERGDSIAEALTDALDATGKAQKTSAIYKENRRFMPGNMPDEALTNNLKQFLIRLPTDSLLHVRGQTVDINRGENGAVQLVIAKKQIILYGPPGTGKTYNTRLIACELVYTKEENND